MYSTFDQAKFSITCKVWRKMNGFTSAQMAELNGIPTSTYSFIEMGDRLPTMAEFSRLCETMQFDAKDFFATREKVVRGGN